MKIILRSTSPYIYGFLTAIALSAFIYFEYFELTNKLINTLFGLIGLYGLLFLPRKIIFFSGFWIGIFWCYWIGFSFKYYDMGWATFLVTFGFGIVYALYYGVLSFSNNPFIRAILLFLLTFVWPMDFNWMQLEIIFLESYLGYEKWQFATILFLLASTYKFKQFYKIIPLLFLIITYQENHNKPELPNLKIKLYSTNISQDFKWQSAYFQTTINDNFAAIDKAITDGYDLIVLPESAFPLYINEHPALINALKKRSEHIAILTGTLYRENSKNFNVSCLFQNQSMHIAKKTILVPFGEYIPLPKFMQKWFNEHIFDGGANFITADKATDFRIKNNIFRNAICYEGTREELFDPSVHYMIVMSNNGWFTPSIEPTLQKLLMRFYARKNHTVIFHAANGSNAGIIY